MGSQVVFFLTRLTSEDVRDDYERWVRTVDTPLALQLDGVLSYRVVRLEEDAMTGVDRPGYSYIEIIEVSDLQAYRAAISGAPQSFFDQFRTFIGSFDAVAGRVVNPVS
jgi:hypothetical protein